MNRKKKKQRNELPLIALHQEKKLLLLPEDIFGRDSFHVFFPLNPDIFVLVLTLEESLVHLLKGKISRIVFIFNVWGIAWAIRAFGSESVNYLMMKLLQMFFFSCLLAFLHLHLKRREGQASRVDLTFGAAKYRLLKKEKSFSPPCLPFPFPGSFLLSALCVCWNEAYSHTKTSND